MASWIAVNGERSSPWNYKVLSVLIQLFTYSIHCDILFTLCEGSLVSCVHSGHFLQSKKSRIYRSLWNANTLKLNISKLLRMQVQPYNCLAVTWYTYNIYQQRLTAPHANQSCLCIRVIFEEYVLYVHSKRSWFLTWLQRCMSIFHL